MGRRTTRKCTTKQTAIRGTNQVTTKIYTRRIERKQNSLRKINFLKTRRVIHSRRSENSSTRGACKLVAAGRK